MILSHVAVDFSDISNDGDEVVLLAIPSGMVLVTFWSDPATSVAWDGDPIPIGQGPEFEADPHDQKGWFGQLDNPRPNDGENTAIANFRYRRTGGTASSSILVPSAAGSIRAANASTVTLTAGHDDLYFLFDTPSLTPPTPPVIPPGPVMPMFSISGEQTVPLIAPSGPPTYPFALFRGQVINPTLDWAKGILHVSLDCRDMNRLWHRMKAGVPIPGNYIIQGDGTEIEIDGAAAPFGDGSGLKDASVFRFWVIRYSPVSPPNLDDALETNPDWVYTEQLERFNARTDVGSFLDEFIAHQDPYTRYHRDADDHAWYRRLAPVGRTSSQAVAAPFAITDAPADLGTNIILADITPSWDMERLTRRVFVRGATKESSGWVVNEDAPLDAGEDYIDALGATTAGARDRIGAWHLANRFRTFLTGSTVILPPSAVATAHYARDGWRVGQTLNVKSRVLSRYLTHPLKDDTAFLPTIITGWSATLPTPAGLTEDGDDVLLVSIDGTPLPVLRLDWPSFSVSETGFAQPGSAHIELWIADPDETIEIRDLAPILIQTTGAVPLEYALTFGDVEPGSLPEQFAADKPPAYVQPPAFRITSTYEDPDMPPGDSSRVTFQVTETWDEAAHIAVPITITAEVWGDEDESVESDEYTIDLDLDVPILTNVYGQVYGTVSRALTPTVPAVKWDFSADWFIEDDA